jgi:hypothetical protein
MKKLALIVLVGLVLIPMAYAQGPARGDGRCGNQCGAVAELPYQEVDAAEREDLVFMREEEKLARDVYRALDDLWGMRVFRNIGGAEQSHMNAILSLLDKYEIPDPVGSAGPGEFSNPQLQTLYDELIAQGSQSLIDGLVVGATIEDLDIHDLDTALGRTDNEDIRTVYQNLQKGSRNHLRAFVGLLEDSGVTYDPQYISADEFEQIMSTPWERGCVDADGESGDCPARSGRRHRHNRTR